MTRIVYVNGRYLPYRSARVHVEDRGFQFGDAVYEVIEVKDGCLVDETLHVERLMRSLRELAIDIGLSMRALSHIFRETVRRNRVRNGSLYLQVTRGQAPRDFFLPPAAATRSTIVCLARRADLVKAAATAEAGVAVKSMPDVRWGRCDIKTVMLLPAVLAKEEARKSGARDAWFIDRDGFVTEGASNNAWIITKHGEVVTRPLGRDILPGVTRRTLMAQLAAEGLKVIERPFSLSEAYEAAEAFYTAATGTVMPVVRIDEKWIGDGKPGKVTQSLRLRFHKYADLSVT